MNSRLKHIEFVNLGPGRALVILVGEDGSVENRVIEVPRGLPPSTFAQASNYLSTRFQGKTIDEVQRFVRDEMESLRRELDEVSVRVVESGIGQWSGEGDLDDKTLIVRGQANLIDGAAAEDLERIRRLFEDLEQKEQLIGLLDGVKEAEGVRIFIGAETRLFSLSGSAVIAAPYMSGRQKVLGAIGVIGPA
eukprot:gene14939-19089_t